MTILAELHDFRRFEDPRHLMAYLGLVPSEHSSGERTHRGPITKTGNSHVRRILVEAAWHYRHRPAVGVKLRKRREGQPQEICAIADSPDKDKKRFLNFFGGGKVLGEARIDGDKAEVDFTFGDKQEKQETMNLRRIDSVWYLDHF